MKNLILTIALILTTVIISHAKLLNIRNSSTGLDNPGGSTFVLAQVSMSNQQGGTLAANVLLGDASPNPAKEYTWISYTLPRGTQSAQLILRNLLGNQITSLQLDVLSNRVKLETGTLNNGIYIYSLVADNKTLASRRVMVSN